MVLRVHCIEEKMETMMKQMNLVPQEEPLYNNVVLSPKMDKGNKDIEEKLEKALFDLTDYKNQFWQEKEDMIRTATNFAKPIDENVTPEP